MDDNVRFPAGINATDIIAWGLTGVVASYDENKVIKFPPTSSNNRFIEIEKRIYERLNNGHTGILQYHGSSEHGLILEYVSNGSLREYMTINEQRPSLSVQLRWAQQLTESLLFIHSKNIFHGDISCNNAFLDENLNIRLGDFAGSSIDGEPVLIWYEASHQHPYLKNISVETELFAIGSTLYEISTGSKPYRELSYSDIEAAYRAEKFPDLKSTGPLSNIIENCWQRKYASSSEVLEDIRREKHETIHAIRPIKSGSEITISYDHGGSSSVRQAFLKESFGFNCTCSGCNLSPSSLQASDHRRTQMQSLDEAIGDSFRMMSSPRESLRDCYSLLQVLKQEFDGGAEVLIARLYYDAFQISIAHGDQARASIFAERAYQARVICEGEDSPETLRVKSLALMPVDHSNFGVYGRSWQTSRNSIPKGLDMAQFNNWLFRQES